MVEALMNKNVPIVTPASPEAKAQENAVPVEKTPQPRVMPTKKAKELIRKTSVLHDGLFSRLAK
jgi:hypothetical protein